MTAADPPRLSRALPDAPPAPKVRMVHLGVGNFSRSHQAWYTWHSPDAEQWGIAAFTGRGASLAEALDPQDGLYTLIVRADEGDTFELIGSLAAVHPAADHATYLDYVSRPETSVVTITVTEAGYVRGADGRLDVDSEIIKADRDALRSDPDSSVASLPAKLVAGLLSRRAASSGPLTILSCDNLPGNGEVTRVVVEDLVRLVDESLLDWMGANVDFATSMVDRITPATTDDDRAEVLQRRGYVDAWPVPTEPFHEWVVSGRFPAGRPRWEHAGAMLVDDVEPYEHRKLWLLNGSHSQLAYAGSIRGHTTIDEAIADPDCLSWVNSFWDEACRHLTLPPQELTAYREALVIRFSNTRVRHQLAQIARDGSQKLVVRTVPTLRAERAEGRMPLGCATTVGAWVRHLRGEGATVDDPGVDELRTQLTGGLREAVRSVLDFLDPGLGRDSDLVEAVQRQADQITAGR